MKKQWVVEIIAVLVLMMLVTACVGNTTTPIIESEEPEGDGLPPVAAVKAREALSVELNIGIEEVTIVSHEQNTWSDSCLGLGGAAESCLRTDIDGWLVTLSMKGQTYKAHTDWLGDQVRFET